MKKYIILSLVVTVLIVTTSEALNYTWTWGGNRASWTYSDSGYVYPSHSIHMKQGDSIYLNGVTLTSGTGGGGSGDVVASANNTLSGNNTFSNGNTFSDSLRATGYTIIDDAKITTNLRVTGDVTTDLNFLKGSKTNIGTISTDSLAFITNNIQRMVISKDGKILMDTLQILKTLNVLETIHATGNIFTDGNFETLADIIGANVTATSGVFTGDGSAVSNVDAITIKGQDTSNFARTDTLTTERVKAKTQFSDVVTFFLSPVFSALVNFANGITVTGTATFNGDLVPTWVKNQSSVAKDQYEKVKIVRVPLTATPPYSATTFTAAHGINWRTVTSWTCLVQEDSLNVNINVSVYGNDGSTNNIVYNSASVDSINVRIRIPAAAVNLFNDTAKFRIIYADTTAR